MKILTVCQGGACRSVSLARVLKDEGGHDALAAAWRYNSHDTFKMLCTWAEVIIVMQPGGVKYLPVEHRARTLICDVGPDRWGSAIHPELTDMCRQWAIEHQFIGV